MLFLLFFGCVRLWKDDWEQWLYENDVDGDGRTEDEDCAPRRADTYVGAAFEEDPEACMTDADGDGWGAASEFAPEAEPGTDCDDNAFLVNPGQGNCGGDTGGEPD